MNTRAIQARKWRAKNREKANASSKKYRDNNKEKHLLAMRRWAKNNKDKKLIINRKAKQKRRATINGLLDHRMEVAVRKALKTVKNGRRWELLVGYTIDDLKKHLENKFIGNMTWNLLLEGKIHIDHIKPRCLFKYTSTDEASFKECWSLSNLQPLWAFDNRQKSDKYNE
jgi:hypothetical protein